jgi:GMP synthase (glutamine-hydrolysing)
MAHFLGGKVERGAKREYGKGTLSVTDRRCALFANLAAIRCRSGIRTGTSWRKFPKGFKAVATSDNSEFAAIEDRARKFFRPAISSRSGAHAARPEIIANFVHGDLRLRQGLDDAPLPRPGGGGNPRAGGQANASSSV